MVAEFREIDGIRVGFIDHATYFGSFSRETSMVGVSRDEGAQVVMILGPGKTMADVSDDDVRGFLAAMGAPQEGE
jgi:hypothetical protein